VPKSRVRKKKTAVYTPPPIAAAKKKPPSPRWFGAIVLGLMLLGVIWLVTFYVTQGELPVSSLKSWNVLVGFAFIAGGFGLATQWR
jgi:hypothetical protein